MPATAALTEFNRNPNALIAELERSSQPTYLTKNGKACAVIMSPEAYERSISFRNDLRERELRVYDGIMRGIEDVQAGRTTPAREGLAAIRARKGWE